MCVCACACACACVEMINMIGAHSLGYHKSACDNCVLLRRLVMLSFFVTSNNSEHDLAEDSGLLGFDTVSIGQQFLVFQGSIEL